MTLIYFTASSAATSHQLQQYKQGEQLERMLKEVLNNQRRILSYVVPESEHTQQDYNEIPSLPLCSEEEYDEFEAYLDLKHQKQLVVSFGKLTNLFLFVSLGFLKHDVFVPGKISYFPI